MADDSKIVIELDLETGDFQTKIGSIQSMLESAGEKGKEGFSGLSMEALGLNAALELVSKAMEVINLAAEKMEAAEKMDNQAKALDALTKSLGVNANTLVESIKVASSNTLTTLQAQQEGFKLLSAGIRADQIPALVELAHQYELTGKTGKSTSDILNEFSRAIESGTTRGLKEFGIASGVAGDRQRILNAILLEGKSNVQTLGADYDSTAEKFKAKSQEMWDGVTKWTGHAATAAFNFFTNFGGDKVAQSENTLKNLEGQMKSLEAAQAKGSQAFAVWKDGLNQVLPIEQARAELQKQISAATATITQKTQEDSEAQKARIAELSKGMAVQKELTNEELKKLDIDARVVAAQKEIDKVVADGGVAEIKQYQALVTAKKAQIDFNATQEEQLARSEIKNREQLTARLIAIEKQKAADIAALQQGAQKTEEIQAQAHLKYLEQNARIVEGYSKEVIATQTKDEDTQYKNQIARLQLEVRDDAQFKKQVEQAEMQHQQRITAIKNQYNAVNMKNLEVGVTNGLAKMQQQFSNFSTIAEKTTVQTQSVMSNAFVQAAKGQGNALELMKQQFMEMIGTQLIQKGTFDLLAGIWPPNPVQLSLGAAEIAAGSALVGAGGSSASTSSASGAMLATGGVGGGGISTGPSSASTTPQKSASIVINGDFLNSSETANHLASILRANSDVTDYSITSQGKSWAG